MNTRLIGLTGVLLACGAFGAQHAVAQTALDPFDPNVNGTINVVVDEQDGKILIGGSFSTVAPNGAAPVTRNNIARLNADGTVDATFDPNANGPVNAILLTGPIIVVGGNFSQLGGQSRNNIALLDFTTGQANAADPNAFNEVLALALDFSSKILVGGRFDTIGGQTRHRIARIDSSGAVDSYNPNANGDIAVIVPRFDGILVGGDFNGANSIGGQARNRIARLDAATGLADSFNPNANGSVFSIALQQGDDKILVGGAFNGANSIGGQARNFIARLDGTTGLADSFNPSANNNVQSIALQLDGKILVGGLFNGGNSIGGQTRNHLARLNPTTGAADSFDPNVDGAVESIVVLTGGKIVAGGLFTSFSPNGTAGVSRGRIARLEKDGGVERTLDLNVVGSNVVATAVQPDGKILIGGLFSSILGVTRNNIARLNVDGTLDAAFNPNANGAVFSIAVQPDGKILVGGVFGGANSIGGQLRNRIARLNATTGAADSFDPNSNGAVSAIAVQRDGKILAGGSFTGASSIGGQLRNFIARLDATTGLADTFDPNANNSVQTIVVQPDGLILVGGVFNGANSIGGQARNRIARLDPATGLADSFDPNANGEVDAIAIQADGKVLVGGGFSGANSIGGQTRNFIARLDASTGLADTFNPNANSFVLSIGVQANGEILVGGIFNGANAIAGQTRNYIARFFFNGSIDSFNPNANGIVHSIAMESDGRILVGGDFNGANSICGQTRNFFARVKDDPLSVDTAFQFLNVSKPTITWSLSGATPQFTRVTFEYSTDSVNYSALGDGTPSGSNWTRTGLNLSTGHSIFIRARGYYRSGSSNGSQSLQEYVQNIFLSGPTAAAARIRGSVTTVDGTPLGGVALTLNGASTHVTVTDSDGNYHFEDVEAGGFYTVTPALANFHFAPGNRSFSLAGNSTDATFTGLADPVVTANPLDSAAYFVRQQYLDFLDREPDQDGFEYWRNQIAQCGLDANCQQNKRLDVARAFFLAPEFQRSGAYVYRIYKTALGRAPGFAEFQSDRPTVIGGLNLDQSKADFALAFVGRANFIGVFPRTETAAQFVDALLSGITQHSGVDLTTQRSDLIELYDGTDSGRAKIVRQIADDQGLIDAEYNREFVFTQYAAFLRRDADPDGFLFWLRQVNSAPLRDPAKQRAMVRAFITSVEYRQRFSTVVAECRTLPAEISEQPSRKFAAANQSPGTGNEAFQVSRPRTTFSLSLRNYHVSLPTGRISEYMNQKATQVKKALDSLSPKQEQKLPSLSNRNLDELADCEIARAMTYDVHHSGKAGFKPKAEERQQLTSRGIQSF